MRVRNFHNKIKHMRHKYNLNFYTNSTYIIIKYYYLFLKIVIFRLINKLRPGSVKKVNTMNAPFKQRENIELYLKGCENYGLHAQDLFQVNDLFEAKNLYMISDNLFALGGLAQRNGYDGPVIGKKMATQNKREFDQSVLKAGQSVIGLQYGSNKGASQAGMTAYGTGRQIRPEGTIL